MAGRSEDPNKLVTIACKVPTSVRDRFAAIALLKGDVKVARRLERLIMADIAAVELYRPFPVREDKPKSILEADTSINLDSANPLF